MIREFMMSAQVNHREIIHEGGVFRLVKENVTLENNVTVDVDFIEHPGATAIIPFLDDDRIIILNQYRHALRRSIWEIPAGTLDPQESDISCAKRELIEETGFSAAEWHNLGEITPVPGYSDERIHIFLARELQPAEQKLDKDELIKVTKVKLQDALDMIARGEIQDSKSISGLYLALNWLNKHRSSQKIESG